MATLISIRSANEVQADLASRLDTLENVPYESSMSSFICAGDRIDTDLQDGFLRGHGTRAVNGSLHATVCGVVERVNKLVTVRPLRQRYTAELGDVVIGRVKEIGNKRWVVDMAARQGAALLLSSVNLPGGIQRRRTAEDELNMRTVFEEGDLISAEVQSLYADGSIMLHTRSAKYGKLACGQLVIVPSALVRRQKQHFAAISDAGVNMILGVNGWIWVTAVSFPMASPEEPADSAATPQLYTAQQREAVARAAASIKVLATLQFAVSTAATAAIYKASVEGRVAVREMLGRAFLGQVVDSVISSRMMGGS